MCTVVGRHHVLGLKRAENNIDSLNYLRREWALTVVAVPMVQGEEVDRDQLEHHVVFLIV